MVLSYSDISVLFVHVHKINIDVFIYDNMIYPHIDV